MHRNPELEDAIRANPDDETAFVVYGDWLLERGDVVGQLVEIQRGLAAAPEDPELLAREAALFEAHAEALFGPPHPFVETRPERRENRFGRRLAWPEGAWRYGYADTQWEHGFIRRLRFDSGYFCDDDDSQGSDAASAVLAAMLAHPTAAFVRELAIGDVWGEDYEGPQLQYPLLAVGGAPCASVLRELHCTGGEHDISGVMCHLESDEGAALWRKLTALRALTLYGNDVSFGVMEMPSLRKLAFHSGGLPGGVVTDLVNSALPALEDLELWFGRDGYGASVGVEDLAPILDGSRFPRLTRLGLMNGEFGDALCAALPGAAVLPRLKSLDLTMGVITDDGARALLAQAPRFAHLSLAIEGYFSGAVTEALRGIGAEVVVRGSPDDRYKYASVGE